MKTPLQLLSLLALVMMFAGCKSRPAEPPMVEPGGMLYTQVGMHFDAHRGQQRMYTTNYVGVPTYLPPGTALTMVDMGRKDVTLADDSGVEYVIRYIGKHSIISFGDWMQKNFSLQPVQMPETLTEEERNAIAVGDVRVGMSRDAVFMAWGYPPQSTNPSLTGNTLVYEMMRFRRRTLRFDENDCVASMGG